MLADGTLVRTGFGAIEGSREWQAFKLPFGPVWDGMFTQSNFAVVTKMGLWLMPEPAEMAGVTIDVPGKGDLAKLVDTLRPLKLDETINTAYTIANGMRQITGGARREDDLAGGRRDLARTHRRSPGAARQGLVERHLQPVRAHRRRDGPAGREDPPPFRRRDARGEDSVVRWKRGEPQQPWMRQDVSLAPFAIVDWRGSPGGHSDFGPVVAAVGERVKRSTS